MAVLTWDDIGERYYETGVRNGVLYLLDAQGAYSTGVAWNGLTAINESHDGGEPNALYADDMKYLNLMSAEDFKATIEAYTYPDEFAECDGSASLAAGVTIGQQKRKAFGLSYQTRIGNDVDQTDLGYKIHLVYGCMAAPTDKNYASINESPEAITFSWEVSTTPVDIPGHKPSATIVIDSTKADPDKLATLKGMLYGTANASAKLPTPQEIIDLFTTT